MLRRSQRSPNQAIINRAYALGFPRQSGIPSASTIIRMRNLVAIHNRPQSFTFEGRRNASVVNAYSGRMGFRITRTLSRVDLSTLGSIQTRFEITVEGMIRHAQLIYALPNTTRFQVIISDGSGNNLRSVATRFVTRADDISTAVIDALVKKLQSNDDVLVTNLKFMVKWIVPNSGGAYATGSLTYAEFAKRKRAITRVYSENNDCFARCVALGLSEDSNMKLNAHKKNNIALHNMAQDLMALLPGLMLPVSIPNGVKLFEEAFEFNAVIINYQNMEIIYKGSGYSKYIIMLFSENENGEGHFDYVNSDKIGSLWNYRKYCYACMKGYQDNRHRCVSVCYGCKKDTCPGRNVMPRDLTVYCTTCNLCYYDQECFNTHLSLKCRKEKRCTECNLIYTVSDKFEHRCGLSICRNCQGPIRVNEDHMCYQKRLEDSKLHAPHEKYIFYDYECLFDGDLHVPAKVVAAYVEGEPMVFEPNQFIEWLFSATHQGYTCIAHNASKYDFHFIKREMIRRQIISKDIVNGNAYVMSYIPSFKLRFIDSLKFIGGSLRSFTKIFGIDDVEKGYFPYRFYTAENKYFKGNKLPPIEYYDFHQLKNKEDYDKAIDWYCENKDKPWSIDALVIEYCVNDVKLLREGCMRFRNIFLELTNGKIDPFTYITVASVCMAIYKNMFLPERTIAIFNTASIDYSKYLWLDYMKDKHDLNVNEISYNVVIDGVCWDMITLGGARYLFSNCVDIGCKRCFSFSSVHPTSQVLMHELRYMAVAMMDKINTLREHMPIYTCNTHEWVNLRAMSEKTRLYMLSNSSIKPLDMRDAFFGGRTEPIKLAYKCLKDEKIRYLDYTSLYPSIQFCEFYGITEETKDTKKRIYYPTGHYERIIDNFGPLDDYFGFVKCYIKPPKDLYIPLLPERGDGKLLFTNTAKIGTWTTVEVLKAIELGYELIEIYEILHFKEKSSELFKEYVSKFLKIKYIASGKKKLGIETVGDAINMAERLNKLYLFDIKPEELQGEFNAGMYAIAKLCLNSLWGKYGQRDVFSETVDTFCSDKFQNIVSNDHNDIKNVFMHDNISRTINYEKQRPFLLNSKNTNIAIAAFTTSYARLRLYEALEILNTRVLYMDTDSIIFVETPESDMNDRGASIVTGDRLGDLTSELDDAEWIIEFVSTGPKSYAYKTNKGKECCKVKGISMNVGTQEQVNFTSMKDMVFNGNQIVTKPLIFDIGKSHDIRTRVLVAEEDGKVVRFTFDKRRRVDNGEFINTLPF